MNNKILVLGIIVLFIGVGVQPAFANEVSITKTSDVEEDCECQPIDNHNLNRLEKLSFRIEKSLNRAKIFTNIVAILYKKLYVSGKATMGIPPPKEIDYYNVRSQGPVTHMLVAVFISGKADFEEDENGWKPDEDGVYWADPIDLIITGYMCYSPNPWHPKPDIYCYFDRINVLPDVDLKLIQFYYFGYAKNNRLSGIGIFGGIGYYD